MTRFKQNLRYFAAGVFDILETAAGIAADYFATEPSLPEQGNEEIDARVTRIQA